jgi:hypothetical protein
MTIFVHSIPSIPFVPQTIPVSNISSFSSYPRTTHSSSFVSITPFPSLSSTIPPSPLPLSPLSLSGGVALRISNHAPRRDVEVHWPEQSAPEGSRLREVQRGPGTRTGTRTAPTHLPTTHVLELKEEKKRSDQSRAEQGGAEERRRIGNFLC